MFKHLSKSLAALAFAAASVSAYSATLSLVPSSQTISGTEAQLNLVVSELGDFTAPSLGAFDVEIAYDDSILSLSSATFGTWLGQSMQTVTESAASVQLIEVSLEPTEFLNDLQPGNFLLATLLFKGVGMGTSAVDFSSVVLSDALGNELRDPTLEPASIGVETVVPVPAAAWLFGSGLLGLLGVARRRGATKARFECNSLVFFDVRRGY